MNKVLKHLNLKGFETKVFPAKLCTIPSPREEEEGVMESKKYFVCVVVDKRFDNQLRTILLRPYLWTEPDEKKSHKEVQFFGWVDESGNVFSHYRRAIHVYDHDHVVAWKPA